MTSERLVEALKQRGQTWYGASGRCTGVQGTDVCVLSKYPIEEAVTGLSTVPGGVDMKVRLDVNGYDVLSIRPIWIIRIMPATCRGDTTA